MNRRRRLLPTSSPLAPAQPAAKTKRQQVTVACNECRRGKVKCNGQRPACSRCARSNTACTYDAEPDVHPTIALRRKYEALQRESRDLRKLFEVLKHCPEREAHDVLSQVRSSTVDTSPSSVLALIKEDEGVNGGTAAVAGIPQTTLVVARKSSDVLSTDPPRFGFQHTSAGPDGSVVPEFNLLCPSIDIPGSLPRSTGQPDTLAIIEYIGLLGPIMHHALASFIQTTGPLFYSYTQAQVDECLATIKHCPAEDMTMATVCEICSIAAVGSQYARDHVPSGFGTQCYDIAKRTLDDCYQAAPLKAMKICALLTMYSVINEPTTALSYIETGLDLAHNQHVNGNRPSGLGLASWTDAKKICRTLIFCNGWLEPTLGYMSKSINSSNEIATSLIQDIIHQGQSFIDDEDEIQIEITKVSILKAEFLYTIVHERLSVSSVQKFKEGLEEWYDGLPEPVSLNALTLIPVNSPNRRLTYYVHALHLNVIMLLYRRILSQCLMRPESSDLKSPDIFPECFVWMDEGTTAARQSAHIAHLVFTETGPTRQCWMCMFQAYGSCCILLYDAVQKLLWGLPEQDWSKHLLEVDLCLEVLFYGSKTDPISRKLHNALKVYAGMLHAARTSTDEDEAESSSSPSSPSFSHPESIDPAGQTERSDYLFATLWKPGINGDLRSAYRGCLGTRAYNPAVFAFPVIAETEYLEPDERSLLPLRVRFRQQGTCKEGRGPYCTFSC